MHQRGATSGFAVSRLGLLSWERGRFGQPSSRPSSLSSAGNQRSSDLVHDNPDEITIVAIGPLTNVALALKSDATVGKKIKEILIMGGNATAKGRARQAARRG